MIEFSFVSIFIFVIIVSSSPAFDNLERLRADLFFSSLHLKPAGESRWLIKANNREGATERELNGKYVNVNKI